MEYSKHVATYQRMQETYSPVGNKKRRMYWSACQSTGAEIRKYFTKRFSKRVERQVVKILTVVDLLESDLGIMRQSLLGLCA